MMVVKPLDLIQQPWLKVGRGVRMFGKLARRRGADGTEEPPRLTDFPTKPANGLHPPSNNITLCHFMPAASLSFAVVFFSDRDYVPVVAGLKVDASKGTLLLQAQYSQQWEGGCCIVMLRGFPNASGRQNNLLRSTGCKIASPLPPRRVSKPVTSPIFQPSPP